MPRHDIAATRQSARYGRERGCRLNIPAEVLESVGIDPKGPPPKYRLWPGVKERRGRIVVQLLKEDGRGR